MRVDDRKLKLIRREIEKPTKTGAMREWIFEKEPLLMLALVVTRVKPGATLPAVFAKDELPYYENVLGKLRMVYQVVQFTPPHIGKRWVIDVAKDRKWLAKFKKDQIPPGAFYGYPACCQQAYLDGSRCKLPDTPYALNWAGLVPCQRQCPRANTLAKQWDGVIKSLLPKSRYRVFKEFWGCR
jgi:hypothetical protein